MLNTDGHEKLTDAAIEEAAEWFVRMNNPVVSEAVRQSFNDWLGQDTRHKQAYAATKQLWTDLKEPAVDAARSGWHRQGLATRRVHSVPFGQMAKWTSIAATVLVLIGGAAIWRDSGLIDRAFADYAVAPGATRMLTLNDGSTVYLDGDSAINTHFTAAERNVEIIRGRVWFDVTRDENRPFQVVSGAANIRVLGTAFAVALEPALTTVTVERGLVAVNDRAGSGAKLEAGDVAFVTGDGVERQTGHDAEADLAWRRGLIIMNQTPLRTVLNELGKYSQGRIVLADENLASLPVSGVFQTQNPDAVFDALRSTLNLSVVRVPGLMTIIYQ